MKYQDKVNELKSSFSVESVPLIYTDRFSEEELKSIRNDSKAHNSHWHHIHPKNKKWTDEEINDQITTFMSITLISEPEFNKIVNNLLKRLPFKNKDSEKITFIKTLSIILNVENLPKIQPDFWRNFGSAPYFINKNLAKYKKKFGACGMHEIFGEERFSTAYHLIYAINNSAARFDNVWKNHLETLPMLSLTSNYDSLDDLENNVVVKKIHEEARKFYHDKSKAFDERLLVFSKHGNKPRYIYDPKNLDLRTIFTLYTESDYVQRHETIDTVYIVDDWIERLSEDRLSIDWKNEYHPKRVVTERNYEPSPEALARLRVYYLEKLMLEEVCEFELDW